MMPADVRARSVAIALAAASMGGAACHRSEAAVHPPEAQAPDGEVWLTPQQVRDAKIEVQALANHDVDDTILTSGTVALEDFVRGTCSRR